MSNSGLETTGLKYIIDDSELNAVAARIQKQLENLEQRGPAAAAKVGAALEQFAKTADISFNEKLGRYVDNGTKKIISQADAIARTKTALAQLTPELDKIDKATRSVGGLDYNSRSLRTFAADLVSVTGAGGQATGILTSLLYAVGPLDVAFAAAGVGVLALKAGLDAAHSSFEKQQQDLANTTHSFEQLYAARTKPTPLGFASALPDILGDLKDAAFQTVGQELGDSFGQAFLQGAAGQLTPEKLARLFLTVRNPLEFLAKIEAGAQTALANQQLEAATAQYVGAAATREQVKALSEEVDALIRAGASTDVLIVKVNALEKAMAGGKSIVTGTSIDQLIEQRKAQLAALDAYQAAYQASIAGHQGETVKGIGKGSPFLNIQANKFGAGILDAQQRFQDDSASAFSDYQDRLAQIAEQGDAARLRLEENFGRQIADLRENERDAELAAFTNLSESLADAEANAAEQRTKNAENYAERQAAIQQAFADRRAAIEQNYQDSVKQIAQSYEEAVFNAAGRNDAHALVEAQRARDRELKQAKETKDKGNAEAEKQRQKDSDAAKKDYEKQQKELNDALAKQERKLHDEYDKRIRQLEETLKKQEAKAAQQHDRDLKDLNDSQEKQKTAEKKHYDARTAQLAKSFADRQAQIIKGLSAEQGLTDTYAHAIIASMKGILDPDQIAALILEFDRQLRAKIDITVTPFAREGTGHKLLGGFDPLGGNLTDPGEWVIPNPASVGASRFNQVTADFLQHRVPYLGGAQRSGPSSRGAAGSATVRISLDSGMLHGVVTEVAGDVVVQVFEEVARVGA